MGTYVRDLNVPAWRKWFNRYSAGNIPEAAADILASATGWTIHTQTWVDCDATRIRGEAPKVRPLATGSVLSRLAHCHAIARIAIVAADHLGHVQRSGCHQSGYRASRSYHSYWPTSYSSLQPTKLGRGKRLQHHFPPVSLQNCARILTCILLPRWLR
jgi:hypothetical protein